MIEWRSRPPRLRAGARPSVHAFVDGAPLCSHARTWHDSIPAQIDATGLPYGARCGYCDRLVRESEATPILVRTWRTDRRPLYVRALEARQATS